jgi:hypothetical protein
MDEFISVTLRAKGTRRAAVGQTVSSNEGRVGENVADYHVF